MRALWIVLAFGLLALVTLPSPDRPSEVDGREARDALMTREMASRGEWLQPLLAGEPRLLKPTAGLALETLARRGLHGGLATSRAVRAGGMALLLAVTLSLAARSTGAGSLPFTGLVFATLLGIPLAARADGTAIVGALFAWLGVAGLWNAVLEAGHADTPRRTAGRFAGWLALGLAFATAGPLVALWPVAGFALHLALVRAPRPLAALAPLSGAAIVAGCALPWYGAMAALHGAGAVARAWAFPYGDGAAGPWFAGALLATTYAIVCAFPWTPLLAAAVRDEGERLRGERLLRQAAVPPAPGGAREHRAANLLLSLFLAASLPLAFWPTPPLTAALGALPAVALLVGRYVERVWRGDAGAGPLVPGATRMTALIGTVIAVLGAAIAPRLPGATVWLQRAAAVLLVTAWAPLLADLVGRRRLAVVLFAAPVAFGAPLALARVLPALEPWLTTRPVADALAQAAPARAPLVVLREPPPSLRLASRHNVVVDPEPWAHPARWQASDRHVYLAVPPDAERGAVHRIGAPVEVLLRSPTLVLLRFSAAEAAEAASENVRPERATSR